MTPPVTAGLNMAPEMNPVIAIAENNEPPTTNGAALPAWNKASPTEQVRKKVPIASAAIRVLSLSINNKTDYSF